jgi:predicted nucleotidyltransferase/predicted transcriptional regulator
MQIPSISKTRLELLRILAQRPMTPSELSRLLKKSLPTITRHLTYLEDFRLVKRVGEEKGRTRPYGKYALVETAILIKVMEGDVGIFSLPLDEDIKTQIRIWSIPQRMFHHYVERFLWEIRDFMPDITAIALYGSVARGDARKDSDIDVLILASRDVARIKKKCGAMVVEKPGEGAKMVMAQVMTPEDFRRALKSESEFAREVVESMLPIYDPNRVLFELRVQRHG